MTSKKKHPKIRKELILCAAIDASLKCGYYRITRDDVAQAANVSAGLVSHYFDTIDKIRKEVIRVAIDKGIVEIIAQGLGVRDPQVLKAPMEIRQKALEFLSAS